MGAINAAMQGQQLSAALQNAGSPPQMTTAAQQLAPHMLAALLSKTQQQAKGAGN